MASTDWYHNAEYTLGGMQVKAPPRKIEPKPKEPDVKGVDPDNVKFQAAPPRPPRPSKVRRIRRKLAHRWDVIGDDAPTILVNAMMLTIAVGMILAVVGFIIFGIVQAFRYWPTWLACLTVFPFIAWASMALLLRWLSNYKEDAVDHAYYN